jgi:hypothetical protein
MGTTPTPLASKMRGKEGWRVDGDQTRRQDQSSAYHSLNAHRRKDERFPPSTP